MHCFIKLTKFNISAKICPLVFNWGGLIEMDKKFRIVAAGLVVVTVVGLSGCSQKKATYNNERPKSTVTSQEDNNNISFEANKKIFEPGQHIISIPYDRYNNRGDILWQSTPLYTDMQYPEPPAGYEFAQVDFSDYRNAMIFIVYVNKVEVEVIPTSFDEGEGFTYAKAGTPTVEKQLTK